MAKLKISFPRRERVKKSTFYLSLNGAGFGTFFKFLEGLPGR
jgi:hypothetical protein